MNRLHLDLQLVAVVPDLLCICIIIQISQLIVLQYTKYHIIAVALTPPLPSVMHFDGAVMLNSITACHGPRPICAM